MKNLNRSVQRFGFLLIGWLLLIACSTAPAPTPAPIQTLSEETLEALDPQPPSLPVVLRAQPLPALPGALPQTTALETQALSADTTKVELRLLVISATANTPEELQTKAYSEPALATWTTLLDQIGVPYEVLIASQETLTLDKLIRPDSVGRFQGILLTTDSLAYFDPASGWGSAFSADEWNLLWTYAREYRVRQVALYSYPGTFPESYGIAYTNGFASGSAPYAIQTTSQGQAIFPYLKAQASIPLRYTWTYLASLQPDATTPNPTPLLRDSAGNVLAVLAPSSDGRERLALTFAHNPYLLHSQLLGYGLIRWVTKGVFLGERRYYLGADVDDWFISQDVWDIDTASITPDAFELSARDAWSLSQQQASLRSRYPVGSALTWTMAFNGEGAFPTATLSCDPNLVGETALSSMTKCINTAFYWINHTWSHAYMDRNPPYYDISYSQIVDEIKKNDDIVKAFGFGNRYANRALVTGDISGLGWYAPNGPDTGPKVDFGLAASNPDLLAAAKNRGRSYIAGNLSTPSHEPPCSGCGIPHPLEPNILVVPRWPTNVFAVVTTPDEAVHAYNRVYGPGGSSPYFDRDLSYDEYLDFEIDIALYHILTGTAYPHYFHVANLREYAAGRSLLTDWTDRLLSKYSSYLNLPLRSPNWNAMGERVSTRTSFVNMAAYGLWDRSTNTITITAPKSGTVFVTGISLGTGSQSERYGGDLISWRSFTAGETRMINGPTSFTLTVSKRGAGGTVTSTPAGISCGASCTAPFEQGTSVTLTATPNTGASFTGWSGACSGTGSCTILMNANKSVTARFR
jgi:hypothetical protein